MGFVYICCYRQIACFSVILGVIFKNVNSRKAKVDERF